MSNWLRIIRTIIKFKKTFEKINKEDKTPNKLLGLLGEYYVLAELERNGFQPQQKGGQGGYDIYIPESKIKIEVKTSLLKNEGLYLKGINFWGWVTKRSGQKKTNYDALIAVALDKYWKPKYYVFTSKETAKSNIKITRYPLIKKAIQLFENKIAYAKALKEKPHILRNRCISEINSNPRKFLDRWDKIKI